MKKTFLAIVLTFAAGIASTFANDNDGISKSVESSFRQDFKTATNVQWQQRKNFSKATFSLDDQVMFAYYNADGRLLAVSKNIASENLPIKLQAELKNTYSNYWISDLFESDSHDATSYYVTLENSDQKITLQSSNSYDWNIYQRMKKDVE